MANTKKMLGIASSTLLVASMGASATVALADTLPDAAGDDAIESAAANPAVTTKQAAPQVKGEFAFTQGDVTSTDVIARAMGAAKYLCGSTFVGVEGTTAEDWTLHVGGEVASPVFATLGELAEEGEVHLTMGCSCAGNPADGLASVNADVRGVSVAYLLEAANASKDANTIVFASADGYEVALPLSYVVQRTSMIVFSVNGGALDDSIGGTNQLWLGSTSARYFVRNVSSVSVETRQTPPPVPGSEAAGDAYANVPNISVTYGGIA